MQISYLGTPADQSLLMAGAAVSGARLLATPTGCLGQAPVPAPVIGPTSTNVPTHPLRPNPAHRFQVNPEVLLGSDQLAAAQEAAVLDPLHNDVQGVHVNALRELRAQASQRAAAEDAEARDKMSPAALEAHRIANIKKKESLQRRASESGAGAGSAPAKVVDLEPPSRTTVLSRIERRFSTSGGGMGAIPSGVNSPSVGLSPRTSVALPSAGALTQEPVPVSALRAGLLGSASLQSRSGRFSEGGGALSLDGPGVPRPQSPASGRGFVRPLRSTMLARGSSVGSEGGASLPSPHEPPARSPLGQGPASPDWDAHMQFAGSEPGSAPGSEIPSPDAGAGAAAAAAPASGIAPQTMARMASASRRSSWAGQAPSDDRPSGQRSLSRRGSMSGGPGSKLPGGGGASSAGLSLAVGAALGAPGIISGALARTTSGMKRV